MTGLAGTTYRAPEPAEPHRSRNPTTRYYSADS